MLALVVDIKLAQIAGAHAWRGCRSLEVGGCSSMLIGTLVAFEYSSRLWSDSARCTACVVD